MIKSVLVEHGQQISLDLINMDKCFCKGLWLQLYLLDLYIFYASNWARWWETSRIFPFKGGRFEYFSCKGPILYLILHFGGENLSMEVGKMLKHILFMSYIEQQTVNACIWSWFL